MRLLTTAVMIFGLLAASAGCQNKFHGQWLLAGHSEELNNLKDGAMTIHHDGSVEANIVSEVQDEPLLAHGSWRQTSRTSIEMTLEADEVRVFGVGRLNSDGTLTLKPTRIQDIEASEAPVDISELMKELHEGDNVYTLKMRRAEE